MANIHQRSMIFHAPACLDALEERIQTNCVAFRAGRGWWHVEANGCPTVGRGRTVEEAVNDFIAGHGKFRSTDRDHLAR